MPNKLIALAAERLRAGGVVAFPTETVYGLGADARNKDAVRRVFAIKGQPRATALLDDGRRITVLRRNRPLRGQGLPPSLPQFLLPARPETYARSLYARLREFDRFGFDRVLVEALPDDETWWAINDRLTRTSCAHRLVTSSLQELP